MKQSARVTVMFLVFIFLLTAAAQAALPDLPKQELWIKVISLTVGLALIFSISIMGLSRLMYGMMGLDAELSTKMSIIIGVIFSFLWFLYLFGQIFDTTIQIGLGVLIVVCGIVWFLREKREVCEDEEDMD
jgi:drug/metabolite transporter (DMT)-like permease